MKYKIGDQVIYIGPGPGSANDNHQTCLLGVHGTVTEILNDAAIGVAGENTSLPHWSVWNSQVKLAYDGDEYNEI